MKLRKCSTQPDSDTAAVVSKTAQELLLGIVRNVFGKAESLPVEESTFYVNRLVEGKQLIEKIEGKVKLETLDVLGAAADAVEAFERLDTAVNYFADQLKTVFTAVRVFVQVKPAGTSVESTYSSPVALLLRDLIDLLEVFLSGKIAETKDLCDRLLGVVPDEALNNQLEALGTSQRSAFWLLHYVRVACIQDLSDVDRLTVLDDFCESATWLHSNDTDRTRGCWVYANTLVQRMSLKKGASRDKLYFDALRALRTGLDHASRTESYNSLYGAIVAWNLAGLQLTPICSSYQLPDMMDLQQTMQTASTFEEACKRWGGQAWQYKWQNPKAAVLAACKGYTPSSRGSAAHENDGPSTPSVSDLAEPGRMQSQSEGTDCDDCERLVEKLQLCGGSRSTRNNCRMRTGNSWQSHKKLCNSVRKQPEATSETSSMDITVESTSSTTMATTASSEQKATSSLTPKSGKNRNKRKGKAKQK